MIQYNTSMMHQKPDGSYSILYGLVNLRCFSPVNVRLQILKSLNYQIRWHDLIMMII